MVPHGAFNFLFKQTDEENFHGLPSQSNEFMTHHFDPSDDASDDEAEDWLGNNNI